MPTIAPRIIAGLIMFALVAFLLIFGPSMCSRYFAEKKAGEVAQGQGKATLDALDEANRTAAELDRREGEISTQTKGLADDIRAAPAGDSNAAADRSLCGLAAYRNSERCARVRAADSAVTP